MQVEMHNVEAHIARPYHSEQRVHIRSVVVEQAAAAVHERGDLLDLLLEEAQGVRVGHHYACYVIAQQWFEVFYINQSVRS